MAYYAWSNFPVEHNEFGQPTKVIGVGEEIKKSDLGKISDADWDAMIEAGAIREQKYPKVNEAMSQSPSEYFRQMAAKAAAGELGSSDAAILSEFIETTPHETLDTPPLNPLPEGVEKAKAGSDK